MSIWISSQPLKWRARISSKRILIASASARPFVRAAAAAGYSVVAADLFCDADTRSHATKTLALDYRDGGFDQESIIRDLLPSLSGVDGFVYGSGFETQPELIAMIARHCRVYGNTAETVASCKNPRTFFRLLADLGIAYPETRNDQPQTHEGWLRKRVGGSGGTHVDSDWAGADPSCYFQRRVAGRPYSLLFAAAGGKVLEVGFNQLLLAPGAGQPFRYGGVVSQAVLPEAVRQGMLLAAQKLADALHLRGLNSLDAMVIGDKFYVLEINPRLSASFALYDAAGRGAALFDAHLQACDGDICQPLPAEPAQAYLIYYAPFDMSIAAGYGWPEWAADLPDGAARIKIDDPVCTVTASAQTAELALALGEQRCMQLRQQTHQFMES